MLLHLTIRPDHYSSGDIKSVCDDPIALAIKETLNLRLVKDIVAVGGDEIYLHYYGKMYLAPLDVHRFHKSFDGKSRSLKIDLTEI